MSAGQINSYSDQWLQRTSGRNFHDELLLFIPNLALVLPTVVNEINLSHSIPGTRRVGR